MKLNTQDRSAEKKTETKRLRREGQVPAVLYSSSGKNQNISLNAVELEAVLRNMEPGHLPTTVFTLVMGKAEKKAIVKEIQYKLTTYDVTHVDFEELFDDVAVSIKVPIQCVGIADCVGIKLGGFLRQVIRHVPVECLPKHIPTKFIIDVKDLGISQSKRLSDLAMPKGVKPLAKMDEVVVVISRRTA
jgi:large subunit ribosomal protein L25